MDQQTLEDPRYTETGHQLTRSSGSHRSSTLTKENLGKRREIYEDSDENPVSGTSHQHSHHRTRRLEKIAPPIPSKKTSTQTNPIRTSDTSTPKVLAQPPYQKPAPILSRHQSRTEQEAGTQETYQVQTPSQWVINTPIQTTTTGSTTPPKNPTEPEEDPEEPFDEEDEEIPEHQPEETFPPPPPSPPNSPPPNNSNNMARDEESKGSGLGGKPMDFNGEHWKDFRSQIRLYLLNNQDKLKTDESKITCVLSFMKYKEAARWAQYKVDKAYEDPVTGKALSTPNFGTYDAFMDEAAEQFGDKEEKRKAHEEIFQLKQGNDSAMEYFQTLDRLRDQAGYRSMVCDPFLLERVRVAINEEVAMEVAKVIPEITEYDAYKTRACQVDRQMRAQRQMHHKDRRPTKTPPRNLFVPRESFRRPEPTPRSTPGVFGGVGEPMQIDRMKKKVNGQCYLCGKTGHFVKECPEGKNTAKHYIRSIQPSARKFLAEAMSEMKESDFNEEDDADYPSDDEHSFLQSEQ